MSGFATRKTLKTSFQKPHKDLKRPPSGVTRGIKKVETDSTDFLLHFLEVEHAPFWMTIFGIGGFRNRWSQTSFGWLQSLTKHCGEPKENQGNMNGLGWRIKHWT